MMVLLNLNLTANPYQDFHFLASTQLPEQIVQVKQLDQESNITNINTIN